VSPNFSWSIMRIGDELAEHKKFFDSLGGVVPQELLRQREQLAARFKL
jgi:hypothetical protein